MNGELHVVDDVPAAFAEFVAASFGATSTRRVIGIGASGGTSGRACFQALAERDDLFWPHVELYFADERCVEPSSADANQRVIADALGARRLELAGFFPMSCEGGPSSYEARLRAATSLDLLQLGLGPDGHTASLFPGSTGARVDD